MARACNNKVKHSHAHQCLDSYQPPWPNGQGVGLLIRRLRVRVPQGVFLFRAAMSRDNVPTCVGLHIFHDLINFFLALCRCMPCKSLQRFFGWVRSRNHVEGKPIHKNGYWHCRHSLRLSRGWHKTPPPGIEPGSSA